MENKYNINLPKHKKSPNDPVFCTGLYVSGVEEDVGLLVGNCDSCRQNFIYMYKSNQWVAEEDFEKIQAKI